MSYEKQKISLRRDVGSKAFGLKRVRDACKTAMFEHLKAKQDQNAAGLDSDLEPIS